MRESSTVFAPMSVGSTWQAIGITTNTHNIPNRLLSAPVPSIRGVGLELRSVFSATAVLASSIDTLSLACRVKSGARHMTEMAQVS